MALLGSVHVRFHSWNLQLQLFQAACAHTLPSSSRASRVSMRALLFGLKPSLIQEEVFIHASWKRRISQYLETSKKAGLLVRMWGFSICLLRQQELRSGLLGLQSQELQMNNNLAERFRSFLFSDTVAGFLF